MNSLKLYATLFLTIALSSLYCQSNSSTGLSAGPIIFYSSGSIDLSPNNRAFRGADLSNFSGISGGITVKYDFDKFFLQTEITIESREANDPVFESVDTSPFTSDLTASFSYINVPLIVGYKFSSATLSPYASAGIQIGVSTKNEITQVFEADTPSFIPQNQALTSFDTSEIGILGELGVRYAMGTKSHLTFGIRYTGAERSYFINQAQISGGSANLGSKKVGIGVGFLFSL